jgi:hypothetical protein
MDNASLVLQFKIVFNAIPKILQFALYARTGTLSIVVAAHHAQHLARNASALNYAQLAVWDTLWPSIKPKELVFNAALHVQPASNRQVTAPHVLTDLPRKDGNVKTILISPFNTFSQAIVLRNLKY